MTQGFYEQLGVSVDAPSEAIRDAYTKAVAQVQRRRKALVDCGGDTGKLDLARAQLDEAWEVLSDPQRRRRYDAMRALLEEGWTTQPDELWNRVAGALVHPAAGAAAELLRVATNLDVGVLPPVPRPGRTQGANRPASQAGAPDTEEFSVTATVARTQPTVVPMPPSEAVTVARTAPVIHMPPPVRTPKPGLKVVDGPAPSAPVIVLPEAPRASNPSLPAEDLAQLVEQHGYTGGLLKAVREASGIALQEMSDATRIGENLLLAVEDDDLHALPSASFVRGYVRQMARLLHLDEDAVVAGYMQQFTGDG